MAFLPFSQILGQDRAVGFLRQAMRREKIPHAYLFVGIRGIGKTTTALAFTRAVNCLDAAEGEGCGQCRPCRQIVGGNFPDLMILEPDGQALKIGQIRELNRALGFKPLSGRYRVSILKYAEMMTEEAANAFLKTLEEPPLGNILILNVTEPLDLLPTVVSRCQKVPFRPLPVPIIEAEIKKHRDLERDQASVLARIAEGSLGRALRMCDNGFLERRETYLAGLIDLPGITPEKLLTLAIDYSRQAKKKDKDAVEKGEGGLFDLFKVWKSWYRDLLLAKTGDSEDLMINIDFSHKLQNFLKHFKVDALISSITALEQAERDLGRMRNLDLMMENLLLSLRRLAG